MARTKKNKKFVDPVLQDLATLQNAIESLKEVLEREEFDECDTDDAWNYCNQIENLAIAIKKRVEQK